MTVRCRDGHLWTVETIGAGICLTRPGAVRHVSRGELESLTEPGLEGLRPVGADVLVRAEFQEVPV